MSTTTSRLFQYSKCDPMLMTKDIASDKGHFEVFPKEKGRFFIMPCLPLVILALLWSCFTTLCHASPDKVCTKDKNFEFYNSFPTFWGQKNKIYYSLSLFTITIHELLFMTLFTPNFCLFKGGCPLCLKQVLVELSSGLLS